ncbi:MAG: xanthine dehydrogenase molybdopterin binding subunit [Rhodospirillaceae bacterium]|nr:xanthine dehydrogenase molybdopterin binding subunit [Rhodospirillaceae bacterium]MDE0362179.1 xanthine dehydrogenase molybdopterin binding subunit [Rhodospirillaceae bacterium]
MDVRADPCARPVRVAVGKALPHDSAHLHVSGAATYTDDLPEPRNLLHLAVGLSARAHARIKSIDLSSVHEFPGVVDVCVSPDIPGRNSCGPLVPDEPILASDTVEYAGQPVFAVAANTVDVARKAVSLAHLEYEELEAVLSPREAVERASFVLPTRTLTRGDPEQVLEAAPHRARGQLAIGGQDHFYLEGQVAMVVPQEDGGLLVYSSTQHPDEVQELVAGATGRSAKDVVCVCRRMGGAFGGKETQAATIACIAAVMAVRTGAACKLRLDRDVDMLMTGKRHDFVVDFDAGFDATGRILGIDFMFASRCGISADLSGPVNDRMMFHCDNAYFLENARIVSHRCKTNTVSNTAFRGFGGPQGMFAIEYVIDDIARTLGLDPLLVRRRNFYADGERSVTPYGQTVEDNIIELVVEEVASDADYFGRRQAIGEFNESSAVLKRGIALTPVKFGISFTATHLNQAGALVHVYKDGTVHLNHGGTEMGQGLFIKVAQVVADELGVTLDRIRLNASDTSKMPNASATAASCGSDLNGKAAQRAAAKIRARLAQVAGRHFSVPSGLVDFRENRVLIGDTRLRFEKLVEMAWRDRVMLWASGFYKTPKIHFDRETYQGRPFFYYTYGAAVSEVIVDTLTGEYRLLRVDIVHDCGDSLNPAIDLGQIEGGFVQGAGWLTSEELAWDDVGALATHSPSTYKIPTCSDLAPDFRVRMLENAANREYTIYRSKAVGEPPLMLAISVFQAIRDAIATDANPLPKLQAPATPEAVLRAIERSWQ